MTLSSIDGAALDKAFADVGRKYAAELRDRLYDWARVYSVQFDANFWQAPYIRYMTIADAYADMATDAVDVDWWAIQVTQRGKTAGIDVADFWRLLDGAMCNGVVDCERLLERLSHCKQKEIEGFGETVCRLQCLAYASDIRAPMWAAAKWFGRGWCSDSGFCYFINALLLHGEAVYRGVLTHPERLLLVAPTDVSDETIDVMAAEAINLQEAREPTEGQHFWRKPL